MPTKKQNPILETVSPRKIWKNTTFVRWALIVLLVLVVVVLFLNKRWFLAAVVDGKPIFRWQLNSVLTSRYGRQTLEGMISETLIGEEAKKQGITVSQADINSKVADVVKGLGQNVNLDDVLRFQGMTKADFESQVRLQLTVEKLLGKTITITDSDITNYIATNSATLTATQPGALRDEAKAAILNSRINEKLQPWFLELEQKAKIMRFL